MTPFENDDLLSASRGTLSPPTRREWWVSSSALAFAGLGGLLDHVVNGSIGVAFVAAFMLVSFIAGGVMVALAARVRRRLGEVPPTSTIVMMLLVYAGLMPPLVGLSGLWLEDFASSAPFFRGMGWWAAFLAAACPAVDLVWRHWNVRSLRRMDDNTQALRLKELEKLAYTDGLTGLANRRCFDRELDAALFGDPPQGALLLIDLDRFKPVNDVYGHAAGDKMLQEIARRMRSAVREGDRVFRLGGDEFAVLLQGADSHDAAEATAARIHAAVAEPVCMDDAEIHPSASIGIAKLDPSLGAEEALRAADAAMYRCKSRRDRTPEPVR